jgi:hypothetical protein
MRWTLVLSTILLVPVLGLIAEADSKPAEGIALLQVMRVESNIVMTNDTTRSPRESLLELAMVPFAVIEDGHWLAPPSSGLCTDEKDWDLFEKKFLHTVFAYHMGELRGPLGVNVLRGTKKAALITATLRLPLLQSQNERALATNSGKLGRRKSTQRSASKEEKAEYLATARTVLVNGIKIPESELAKLQVEHPLVTDFGNGKTVMIGTAVSTQDSSHHALFLVVEQTASGWKPVLADYQHSDPKKGYLAAMRFIDQLDVDGDGIDEIFADLSGGRGSRAYGLRSGRWRVIYEDSRDGKGCVTQTK